MAVARALKRNIFDFATVKPSKIEDLRKIVVILTGS
jgi:hypothetical protein